MVKANVEWSETEPPVEVRSAKELFGLLERVTGAGGDSRGWAVILRRKDIDVTLGMGPDGSFVQHSSDSGLAPYYVALGDVNAQGYAEFYLQGVHHTEIPRRFLVSTEVVRDVVREFLDTGGRSSGVSWEVL